MRVQLRGLSGDPALNGQCGKVGGFEGERVFVKLDNSNRVVKVKTINVRKEGGNAAWTRGEAEGGLGGLFGGVMDALGQGASRIASGEDSNQITELRERAERAERRADRLEVDAGARGEALAEARAELRQRSSAGRPLADQLRDLDVSPARCDSAKLAELSDALADATTKVRDSASGTIDRPSRRRVDGVEAAPRRSPRKKRDEPSRTKASRSASCASRPRATSSSCPASTSCPGPCGNQPPVPNAIE